MNKNKNNYVSSNEKKINWKYLLRMLFADKEFLILFHPRILIPCILTISFIIFAIIELCR